MGAQCKKVNQFSLDKKYSMMKPEEHGVFGQIFSFSHKEGGKAIKRLSSFSNIQYISQRIEFAKEGDHNISTLIPIYDYNMIDVDSEEFLFWKQLEHQYFPSSKVQSSFILLHFQYFHEQSSLKYIMSNREQQLRRFQTKFGKDYIKQIEKVKMWDYQQIDKLSSQQRQLTNLFFQEIEIVRMIDHIIGALFFLNHFQIEHLGIRPENILIDDEGKYILIDRQVFEKESNYELALKYTKIKEDRTSSKTTQYDSILPYLSPEYLHPLKHRSEKPKFNAEKSDIYCVGLIALEMCLLDQKQKYFQYSPYLQNIKMAQFQLNKRLVRAQERYSEQFFTLLTKMLTKDVNERINFAQLIDQLNPLLQKNLQAIKQLHSKKTTIDRPNDRSNDRPQDIQNEGQNDGLQQQKLDNETKYMQNQQELKQKLMEIQKQFKKVMNNRFLLFNRNVNQGQLKQEESRLFTRLSKITNVQVPFRQDHKNNPQFQASASQVQNQRHKSDKRYISGKQLQQIVWKEYQNIKSKRKIK